jgi:selenocysteine lyase/cysteine desulfurase
MTSKTRFVACTHTSNILGTINDIKAIAAVVHEVEGAMFCVDGVAYAPHRPIDVKDLGVDFYSFSWYKVFGPHIAMLYGSTKAQEQLRSLGHFFNPTGTLENKLGLAAANYELTQAIPHVAQYLDSMGDISSHEENLAEILLNYLRSRKDVTIIGEQSSNASVRVPTVSFTVQGWSCKELVEVVEQKSHFGFRWGHFYSKRLCDEVLGLGPEGVIRVSMVSPLQATYRSCGTDIDDVQVHYNTKEEIMDFVSVFDCVVTAR